MNTNAVHSLSSKLAAQALTVDALLSDGNGATDFLVMQARKTLRILAADLQAALNEPLTISPWTPFNARNSRPGVEL